MPANIILEAAPGTKPKAVLLRATNPPSRAGKLGARPHAHVWAALVATQTPCAARSVRVFRPPQA